MTKGENKKRKILRDEFVKEHYDLCVEAFTGKYSKEAHKSVKGRALVQIARFKLDYSPKTVSTDIYQRLHTNFLAL